ncbi:MAG: RDD family protein [Lysobacterales bacterium]
MIDPPELSISSCSSTQADIVYVGFWRRFAAACIDWMLILTILGTVLTPLLAVASLAILIKTGGGFLSSSTIAFLLLMLPLGLYFAWMHSRPAQATLGKMAVGIKVCRPNGSVIDFGQSCMRWLGLLVAALPAGIGLMAAGITERKRGWHDRWTDTVVVDRWAFTDHPERQQPNLDTLSKIVIIFHAITLLLVICVLAFFVLVMSNYPGIF